MAVVFSKKFDVVIFAAGLGKRLRPLTINQPKPLVEINGKSIIERLLYEIPADCISSLNIVIGYKGDLIKKTIQKLKFTFPIYFYENLDYEKFHCSSSLAITSKILLKGALLFNSDIVFQKGVLQKILKKKIIGSFVVCRKPNHNIESDLQKVFSQNGLISNWNLNLINYTSEVLGPVFISPEDGKIISDYIQKNLVNIKNLPCFTLLSKFLANKKTMEIIISENDCFEIDTINDLEIASKFIK